MKTTLSHSLSLFHSLFFSPFQIHAPAKLTQFPSTIYLGRGSLGLLGLLHIDLLNQPLHRLLQTVAGLSGAGEDLPDALTNLV